MGSACWVSSCPQGQSQNLRVKGPAKGFFSPKQGLEEGTDGADCLPARCHLSSLRVVEVGERRQSPKSIYIQEVAVVGDIFKSILPDLEMNPCLPPPQAAAQQLTAWNKVFLVSPGGVVPAGARIKY